MAYRIYTTEGIILGKKNVGEANQVLHVFTRDLGLIRLAVQGVRLEKAKLKNHVQLFSWITLSCVRGKDSWRMTSATMLSAPYPNTPREQLHFKRVYADLMKLLRHFGVYDIPQKELYEKLHEAFIHATETAQSEKTLRLVMPLIFLYTLGYLSREDAVQAMGGSVSETFMHAHAHPKELKLIIEKTLSQVST